MFGDPDATDSDRHVGVHGKFTASRLIGSPPGYVGYEEGGQLSEAVRRPAIFGGAFSTRSKRLTPM